MKRFLCLLLAVLTLGALLPAAPAADRPNFVYILCDDLGYGDVRCLNPNGKIATPQLDRLAAGGMIFTDAHSGSSVCTPTRYGIITGRYAWRSRLKSGVLGGLSPRLIEDGRLTVAQFLKDRGYYTACIGKWHLGMDWVKPAGKDVSDLTIEKPDQVNNVDYTKPIRNSPTALGFDAYFGIAASLDMVPYTFIRNDRVEVVPTQTMKLEMNTGHGGFSREGPGAPGFRGEDVLPAFTREAVKTIAERAPAAKRGQPFFLYLPLTSPHTPILPSAAWRGKSGLNLYADFVMETDDAIGQILAALRTQGIADNTLLIVTSDNGCSPSADYPTLLAKGHNPSHVFRGHKADIFDGGHRVPFLVHWPARVKPGGKSDQLLCLTDFFATAADILGEKPPATAAEDSVSFLPALLGRDNAPLREAVVHHSINGSFAIRQGKWKLELTPSSGGWSAPKPNTAEAAKLPRVQLYDLAADVGETTNVQDRHPDVVQRLTQLLQKYADDGRSTPGPRQPNTTPVDIRKAGEEKAPAAGAKKKKKQA